MECRCLRALMLGTLVLLPSCDVGTPAAPRGTVDDRLGVWIPNAGETIVHASQSGLGSPHYVVVSDLETWRTVWSRAWEGTVPQPTLPPVDFVLASVVVAAPGQRGGQGTVTLDSIVMHMAGAIAYVSEVQMGVACPGAGVLAAPVHMVHAPGHPPVITWNVRTSVISCS